MKSILKSNLTNKDAQFGIGAYKNITWEGPYVGFGVHSLNGDVNGYFPYPVPHCRDIDGESMEFHVGYNKDLTQYGVNNYIAGIEFVKKTLLHDLLGGVKGKMDCPSPRYDCEASLRHSWTAKTKLGFKYKKFLPNLFVGYTNDQITLSTFFKAQARKGNVHSIKTVGGILYGIGVDYYLNNNSFIGFSFYETQMNKEKFDSDANYIDTKLKYNTAKITTNFRF